MYCFALRPRISTTNLKYVNVELCSEMELRTVSSDPSRRDNMFMRKKSKIESSLDEDPYVYAIFPQCCWTAVVEVPMTKNTK